MGGWTVEVSEWGMMGGCGGSWVVVKERGWGMGWWVEIGRGMRWWVELRGDAKEGPTT